MNEFVSIQVSDAQPGIGTLVLSRPPTNAMTRQVYREIIAASAERWVRKPLPCRPRACLQRSRSSR